MLLNEALAKTYQSLDGFDSEIRKMAIEIATKYPCSAEYVVTVIMAHGFDKEETEKYIRQQLMFAAAGF